MHPHLYELDQVHVGIQQNHRDALHAEQLRLARRDRVNGAVAVTIRLRTSISSMLIAAGERLRHVPGATPELVPEGDTL